MMRMPIIKLELEGIKANICHMIADHNKEINDAVQKEISRAIDNIDVCGMVEKGVQDCISSAIEEYFKFGAGRRAISQAVFGALDATVEKGGAA